MSGKPHNKQPAPKPGDVPVAPAAAPAVALEQKISSIESKLQPVLARGGVKQHEISRVKKEVVRVVQQELTFSGLLPPPSFLAEYERIHPGTADRLLKLCERDQELAATEQAGRHAWQHRLLGFEGWMGIIGQALGFVAVLALLALVAYLATIGQTILAGALGAVTIGGIVVAIVRGRNLFGRTDDRADPGRAKKGSN